MVKVLARNASLNLPFLAVSQLKQLYFRGESSCFTAWLLFAVMGVRSNSLDTASVLARSDHVAGRIQTTSAASRAGDDVNRPVERL